MPDSSGPSRSPLRACPTVVSCFKVFPHIDMSPHDGDGGLRNTAWPVRSTASIRVTICTSSDSGREPERSPSDRTKSSGCGVKALAGPRRQFHHLSRIVVQRIAYPSPAVLHVAFRKMFQTCSFLVTLYRRSVASPQAIGRDKSSPAETSARGRVDTPEL
jgi:hypothetical protein